MKKPFYLYYIEQEIPEHGDGRVPTDENISLDTGTAETEAPTEDKTDPETDWKAHAKLWEKRAKANSKAAEELNAIKEAQKAEKANTQEAIALAKAEADALRAENKLLSASAKTGVPVELLAGVGDDPEAFAFKLKEWAKTAPNGRAVVKSEGGEPNEPTLAERLAAAQKDGDVMRSIAIKAEMFGTKQ